MHWARINCKRKVGLKLFCSFYDFKAMFELHFYCLRLVINIIFIFLKGTSPATVFPTVIFIILLLVCRQFEHSFIVWLEFHLVSFSDMF